ncbi:uncharacterized protein LOC124261680 [Haliotis rubra]|uniref:uncharacterized protein LOC124261680 n=1 Tax=Haliotis rubra TaxID=36100 RepID=UPI001EE554CF|nr:uncharacterized protein LOC124261680 [Haliotis rubra]
MEEPCTIESHMLSRQSDGSSRSSMSLDPALCTVKPRISDNSFVAHPEDDISACLAVSHEMYSCETLSHRTIDLTPYEEATSQKLSKCHVTHPEEDTSAEISLETYPQKATSIESARYTRISGNWLRTHPVDDQNSLYTCPLSLKDDLSQSVSLTHVSHPDVSSNSNSLIGIANIFTSELPPESVTCYSMGNKSFVPHSLEDTVAIFDRTDDVLAEDTTFRKMVDGSSSIGSQADDDHGESLTFRKTFDPDTSHVEAERSCSLYEPVLYSDTSFHSLNVRDQGGVLEDASRRRPMSHSPAGAGIVGSNIQYPVICQNRPIETDVDYIMHDAVATANPNSINGPASTDDFSICPYGREDLSPYAVATAIPNSINGPASIADLSICQDSTEDPTPCIIITTMRAHTTRPDESRTTGLAPQHGVYRVQFDMDLNYCTYSFLFIPQ